MKRCRIVLIILLLFVAIDLWAISSTKYDYSNVATKIVEGCSTKYDKAKAIYKWLCNNIAYDTDYSIFTADECFEQKKGVCQAYCELFYRLGEPFGLVTTIVKGDSKLRDGSVSEYGHAWLIVEVEGGHIFIDPTWGAGSVNGGVFTRSENDMSWFHVDPHWMIFTHYPKDINHQMLEDPIDFELFKTFPGGLKPMLTNLGLDAKAFFNAAVAGNLSIPIFYDFPTADIKILKMPMLKELNIGQIYEFMILKTGSCEIALNNARFVGEDEWSKNGNIRSIRFMPTDENDVVFMMKGENNQYYHLFAYKIKPPTADDWARVEEVAPFSMPELKNIKDYNAKTLKELGVDGHKFLSMYRRGEVNQLPKFYAQIDRLKVKNVPLNRTLMQNSRYEFVIKPLVEGEWVIINNETFYRDWKTNEDGTMSISVVPKEPGVLKIAIKKPDESLYYSTLIYDVK